MIVETVQDEFKQNSIVSIGLSGGSTPKPVYENIFKGVPNDLIPNLVIYLVDDRVVPSFSPFSNKSLIATCMSGSKFSHLSTTIEYDKDEKVIVGVLPVLKSCGSQVKALVFPETDIVHELPSDIAERYSEELEECLFPPSKGHHIVILGMGDDGHICSLFPPLSLSQLKEERIVSATTTTRFDVKDRISITIPFLQKHAKYVYLLLTEGKRKIFTKMMADFEKVVDPSLLCARWPIMNLLKCNGGITDEIRTVFLK
ncbi:6-Phosphogluconolactonase like protein [Aduncisulcus paluster]|uniref:6-Phosphogluconolactonase like protein n=1 Tax=Aduncisulcus paluster TaxID=2918883 RepID=A0ABQ5JZR7_9EUKA|nr:6-Phosphogluconolactonase like protein [Aduncisulcus paluster]